MRRMLVAAAVVALWAASDLVVVPHHVTSRPHRGILGSNAYAHDHAHGAHRPCDDAGHDHDCGSGHVPYHHVSEDEVEIRTPPTVYELPEPLPALVAHALPPAPPAPVASSRPEPVPRPPLVPPKAPRTTRAPPSS